MAFDVFELARQLAADPEQRRALHAALFGGADLEGVLANLAASMDVLAQAGARADARLDQVAASVDQLAIRIDELAQAQTRTEARLDQVAASVEQLAQAQTRTEAQLDQVAVSVEQLAQAQTRTEARLDQVAASVEQLAQAQTRTEARLDEVAKDLRALTFIHTETAVKVADLVDVVKGMNDRLGRLDGESFERRCREKGHGRFQRVARRLRLVDGNDLSVTADDGLLDGRLSESEADSLILADAVFEGRSRGDGSRVHLVVEASVTIGHDDVRRARERADLLARLVDTPVLAVVTGEYAPSPVARAAQDADVWQVWQGRTLSPTDELPEG